MTRWFDLFGRPITRRDFVRIGRDVAACIALAGMPADASGRPATARRSVRVRRGIGRPGRGRCRVVDTTHTGRRSACGGGSLGSGRGRPLPQDRALRSSAAPPELGHSVHVEVDGLRPARTYWYRFLAGGQASATGRTRTAPKAEDRADRFRFAFVSCQNYEHGYFTAFDHLAAEDLDLVVHLGDYIYERTFTSSASVRDHESAEVVTLEQYRGRYAALSIRSRAAEGPRLVCVDGNDRRSRGHEQLRGRCAGNATGELPPAPGRRVPGLLRVHAVAADLIAERARHPALPAAVPFGRLLELHVLDTRQHRSDQPCGDGTKPRCAEALDAGRTMMGDTQERWLAKNLRESKRSGTSSPTR